jgi:anhydro-N-acetylmuramic acid kinase
MSSASTGRRCCIGPSRRPDRAARRWRTAGRPRPASPVVYDMRANDMAHGGQGAPLGAGLSRRSCPQATPDGARKAVVFVNIGGISNLTFIGSGRRNRRLRQRTGKHADRPVGRSAQCRHPLRPGWADRQSEGPDRSRALRRAISIASLLHRGPVRRSLDRNDFLPAGRPPGRELADGRRTDARPCHGRGAIILKSAASICRSVPKLVRGLRRAAAERGRSWRIFANALANERGGREVITAEEAGLDGDSMEAEAWAYLAVRGMYGLAA